MVAIIPLFISLQLNVPFYFGGTTALIVVGVALDTLKQVEANLITKKFKGMIRKRRKV